MKTVFHKAELISELKAYRTNGQTIGFVPTMGALHLGHVSLVNTSIENHDVTVVSLFVNPTQFNNQDDLDKYPRTLLRDQKLLEPLSKKPLYLYAPSIEDVYEGHIESQGFTFNGLENEMEGEFRPGHFDGVATIVSKLLEIVKPKTAYFGEKDFQQLQIIKQLVKSLNMPVIIEGRPIYRESDGLAMSSRNERLTEAQRAAAPLIYRTLNTVKEDFGTKNAQEIASWVKDTFKSESLLELEYFRIANSETLAPEEKIDLNKKYRAFIAVFAGDIRLIDNIALN